MNLFILLLQQLSLKPLYNNVQDTHMPTKVEYKYREKKPSGRQ